MRRLGRRVAQPQAHHAQPVTSDPAVVDAYFRQVSSYGDDTNRYYERLARSGVIVGAIGATIGLLGVGAVAMLAPLKTVLPLVFRVDNATGAVERVYDVRGGNMAATEATQRYFLWQYVRLRQGYSAPEAEANFNAVTLMSSSQVQNEYAADFRGTNPNSPQVVLGRDGSASVRWVSTSFLGPKLAQVRFVQIERKGDTPLPMKRMVATIAFDFAPGKVSSSEMIVNPLGFIVTNYRADTEVVQ
jgi:type IV secretion system protein VirB8